MKKILITLVILIVLGSLGGFLFDGVASVDENTPDFNEIFGSVSADDDCEPPEPGYPDDCGDG